MRGSARTREFAAHYAGKPVLHRELQFLQPQKSERVGRAPPCLAPDLFVETAVNLAEPVENCTQFCLLIDT